jgi:Tol biopolymer transport system component/DNA-binding winged helix-turn-helix (wHTH) protein
VKRDFRLAEWTVQPELNCVTKGSELIRIEPKVMHVLVELSTRAGEVVPKEGLMRSVWANTFVGDDVLFRCISELRRVFNDNPRSPQVIQTISKMGYRLIAPVTPLWNEPETQPIVPPQDTDLPDSQENIPAPADPVSQEAETPQPEAAPVAPDAAEPKKATKWLLIAAAALLVVLAWMWARPSQRSSAVSATDFKTVPFTSYPGAERQPAFSPDGNQIVFTWNGEEAGDNWNVYVKPVGSDIPLRLTTAAAQDMSPVWSPDGKWIAFIRRSQSGNAIYMVPASGGPERKLYDMHGTIDWDEPGLSWSPDGKQLIFPDGKSESSPPSIYALSLDTLNAQQLTHPINRSDGDFSPEFSPDGKRIAFIRGTGVGSRGVYVMAASGSEPKRLTFDAHQLHGLAWTRDGSSLVFSSDAGGDVSLWRVPLSGGSAQRLLLRIQ